MDDLFTEPGVRLPTTFASPRPEQHGATPVPRWGWPTPLRMGVTVVIFAGAAWLNDLGWMAMVVFPLAAIACQCVRRSDVLRWSLWSVVGGAWGAAMFIPGTWPVRFAVCLVMVGPFVFYMGSQLRDV